MCFNKFYHCLSAVVVRQKGDQKHRTLDLVKEDRRNTKQGIPTALKQW